MLSLRIVLCFSSDEMPEQKGAVARALALAEEKRRREKRIHRRQRRANKDRQRKQNELANKLKRDKILEKDWHQNEMLREQNFAFFKADPATTVEHPSARGFTFEPLRDDFNARVTTPVHFGYISKFKSGYSHVQFHLRLFGIRAKDFSQEIQNSVRSAIAKISMRSGRVKPGEVQVMFSDIDELKTDSEIGKKLLRKLRARKSLGIHVDGFVAAGAITFKVTLRVSCLEKIFLERGHATPLRRQNGTKKNKDPVVDATFGVQQTEAALCSLLAAVVGKAVTAGELSKAIQDGGDERSPSLTIALMHLPSIVQSISVNDYGVPNDTPRERKSTARKLVHATVTAMSASISQDDVSSAGFGPRFEAVRFVHPTFLNRKFRHDYPQSPAHTSPVFWGRTDKVLVKANLHENSTQSHPACRGMLIASSGVYISAEMDATVSSPVFFGNKVLKRTNKKSRSASAAAAATGALIVSRRSRVMSRRKGAASRTQSRVQSRKVAKMNTQLAFVMSEQAEKESISEARALGSDVHPSTVGYVEVSPWKNDCRYVHVSRYGYPSDEPPLEPPRVAELVHPCAVGYEMTVSDVSLRLQACMHASPVFFGYKMSVGARYKPATDSPWAVDEKKVHFKSSISRIAGEACAVCYGNRIPGCPQCWTIGSHSNATTSKTFRRKQASQALSAYRRRVSEVAPAKAALHTPFLSSGHIAEYREKVASIVTVVIKKVPLGPTVRLQIENHRTVRSLFFLYRSNAPRSIAHQETMLLLLPTRPAVLCLRADASLDGDYALGESPGMLKLSDYGIGVGSRTSHVVMFQVPNLHHPNAENLIRAYISQNVDLTRQRGERAKTHEEFLIAKEMPTIQSFGYGEEVLSRRGEMPSCAITNELDCVSGLRLDHDDIQCLLNETLSEAYVKEREAEKRDQFAIADANRRRIQEAVDARLQQKLAERRFDDAKGREKKSPKALLPRSVSAPMSKLIGARPPPLDFAFAAVEETGESDSCSSVGESMRKSSSVPILLDKAIESKSEHKNTITTKMRKRRSTLLTKVASMGRFIKGKNKTKLQVTIAEEDGAGSPRNAEDGSPTSLSISVSAESSNGESSPSPVDPNDIFYRSMQAMEKRIKHRKLKQLASLRRQKSLAQIKYSQSVRARSEGAKRSPVRGSALRTAGASLLL